MAAPKIVHRIAKHRVLISTGGGKKLGISSGTLARIEDRTFVLTAQHHIGGRGRRDLFINLGCPYQDCSFMIKEIWSDEELDVGFLELDTEAVENYRKGIEPVLLGPKMPSSSLAPKYRAAAIIGYPFAHVEQNDITKTYDVHTIYVLTQVLRSEMWPSRIDKDPAKFMLLEYGEKHGQQFIDQAGNPVMTPIHPGGLSGSGVWKFNPETMDTDEPEHALWGIQRGWYGREQLLLGTYIEPLYERLIDHCHSRE